MVGNVNSSVIIDSIWIYNSNKENTVLHKINSGTLDISYQG